MLTITTIGRGKCARCSQRKDGVQVQTYGCNIRPTMVMRNARTGETETTEGHRFVWPENHFFCFTHFKEFAVDLATDVALKTMHEMAARGELDVNCASYEEAQAKLEEMQQQKAMVAPA